MNNKANDTFAYDLENRLDDFFSDALPATNEPTPTCADLPLKDLKSTVLAIDWEITDDILGTFILQVDDLMEQSHGDKVTHTLLKLLNSYGKYIRLHKSEAHPDTIKRIMAVYSTLEMTIGSEELSRGDKEKMLLEEIRQFKRLKASIYQSKAAATVTGRHPSMSGETPDVHAAISAIKELKTMMTTELTAIREELRQLRNT